MKVPLRFQMTEFDCGTTSVQNALLYLLEREEIPSELIKGINLFTLDNYDYKGNFGSGGTSQKAMQLIVHFMNDYRKKNNFLIYAKDYLQEDVTLELIEKGIKNKGCFVLGTYLDKAHYVLVTGIDKECVYIWDPYYLPANYYGNGAHDYIQIVDNKDYNRIVGLKKFNTKTKNELTLGPVNLRECYYFVKKNRE